MSEYIEGTVIPVFSERGLAVSILRKAAPSRTVKEIRSSGLFEVRFNGIAAWQKGYEVVRKSDGFACSALMGTPEQAWLSSEQFALGNPGYYQPPYFCEKAGKLLWETWDRLHASYRP